MKLLLSFALLCFSSIYAQVKLEGAPQPPFVDAKLQALSASSGFEATVKNLVAQHQQPAWIGYAVPIVPKPRLICCFDSVVRARTGCCSGCRLEQKSGNFFDSTGGDCVRAEPSTHVIVMARIEAGRVQKLRPYTPDCTLDAGGLSVIWLRDVKSSDSVAWLDKLVNAGERRIADGALQALALHADPAADAVLERLLTAQQTNKVREETAFWMAQTRGHKGFLVLQDYARNDSDPKFREHLTFAFTQSEDPGAIPELLRMAKQDTDHRVRGQALFWLAQAASGRAAGAVSDAVENDPDSDVRRKAVFALTQMPGDEGVPLLIKYAKSHRDRAVRKEAIFWLGQSNDPRALDFIEDLLTSDLKR
ncbi:MAG: HEAT repeat domain-containing protein [Acidobacteriales bacterium]|nr:HEAT repeat domain-containing protein [Terriglobales bacterium]